MSHLPAFANFESIRKARKAEYTMATEYGGYERAGKGGVATEGEMENKFASYGLNDPDPEKTEQMKEYMRNIERQKAEVMGHDTGQPGQKEGFMQKLRRGSKDRIDAFNERRRSSATSDAARRSSATKPSAEPENRDIHVVQEGADPNAPTLVVKEKE